MIAEQLTPDEIAPRPCACGAMMPTPEPGDAMQCPACGAFGLRKELGPNAEPSSRPPDPRKAWIDRCEEICRGAVARCGGSKRAWVEMELAGEHLGSSIHVLPGVRGWLLGHGRRASLNAAGQLVEQRLTLVKVCAKTMLEAIARARRISTSPGGFRTS